MIQTFQKYLVTQYTHRLLSKWVVLSFDIFITICAFLIAYLLRFNFKISDTQFDKLFEHLFISTAAYTIAYFIFGSYAGIIRHTGLSDIQKILKATITAGSILLGSSLLLRIEGNFNYYIIPLAIVIIHMILTLVFLTGSRFFIKLIYHNAIRTKMVERRVVIYGAGYSGIITKNALETDTANKQKVVAFLDDDKQKIGKSINGIPIISPNGGFCEMA
ncbi:MAG: nucleoside-diphosphate sugar epimerase/dehydratase, partial [Chitinophagales bacterium]